VDRSACRSSPGSFVCLREPFDDFVVDLVGTMDLQVVHPVALGGAHDLLEPAGANLSAERDGQHDLGAGVPQVPAR